MISKNKYSLNTMIAIYDNKYLLYRWKLLDRIRHKNLNWYILYNKGNREKNVHVIIYVLSIELLVIIYNFTTNSCGD